MQFNRSQVSSHCNQWPTINPESNSGWRSGWSTSCSMKTGRTGPQIIRYFQEKKILIQFLASFQTWKSTKAIKWKLLSRVQLFATPWTIYSPWNSPGQNTGVGCHALHQSIFLTQGSNLHLTSPALAGGFFTTNATWEVQLPSYPKLSSI